MIRKRIHKNNAICKKKKREKKEAGGIIPLASRAAAMPPRHARLRGRCVTRRFSHERVRDGGAAEGDAEHDGKQVRFSAGASRDVLLGAGRFLGLAFAVDHEEGVERLGLVVLDRFPRGALLAARVLEHLSAGALDLRVSMNGLRETRREALEKLLGERESFLLLQQQQQQQHQQQVFADATPKGKKTARRVRAMACAAQVSHSEVGARRG